MHFKSSILPSRPKTSSAAEDTSNSKRFDPNMKRTASQTFNPAQDAKDTAMPLESVQEGTRAKHPSSSHSHSYSISQIVAGSYKQICRRLSTSSTRRPSLSGTARRPSLSGTTLNGLEGSCCTPTRKYSQGHEHAPFLAHQDSAFHTPHTMPSSSISHSRLAGLRCFGMPILRNRRPATSGPSGDVARFNPCPAPVPSNYPSFHPGDAARKAAAAANHERLRREAETAEFLSPDAFPMEDDMSDNESGVGMICSTPEQYRKVQERRFDPVKYLPAELSEMILSNLDAASLITAERVSKAWQQTASSTHVWKYVFLRRFEPEVHVNPAPIMMGGAGIGEFKNGRPAPKQDWKKMYKVRTTINRRWKAGTPSAIYLNGHTDSVYCCQFDENKIITGSRDRTIRVWSMETFECLKVIGGPSNRPSLHTPAELPTRPEMVVNHLSVNGTQKGHSIYHVPEDYHEASILCLQYDDEIMVTGSSDHTCIVWDITGEEYKPLYRLRGHTAGVLDVCLDAKHIISCSKDLSINVWDRKTGNKIRTLEGHRGPVNAVQLRGNLLVSASGDGVAKLWNLDSGVCIKEFPSQDRGLAAVEFSDDAKYVLAGGNDHVIYKFDAMTGQLLHTSEKHEGLVRSLFLDAHNGRVISGSYDQSIRVADYENGQIYGHYENWTTSWILSAKSDYRRVVATSQDGRALILDFGWGVEGKELLAGKNKRTITG